MKELVLIEIVVGMFCDEINVVDGVVINCNEMSVKT